jgi:uncharacterized protein YqfB (UPF0267 family)
MSINSSVNSYYSTSHTLHVINSSVNSYYSTNDTLHVINWSVNSYYSTSDTLHVINSSVNSYYSTRDTLHVINWSVNIYYSTSDTLHVTQVHNQMKSQEERTTGLSLVLSRQDDELKWLIQLYTRNHWFSSLLVNSKHLSM